MTLAIAIPITICVLSMMGCAFFIYRTAQEQNRAHELTSTNHNLTMELMHFKRQIMRMEKNTVLAPAFAHTEPVDILNHRNNPKKWEQGYIISVIANFKRDPKTRIIEATYRYKTVLDRPNKNGKAIHLTTHNVLPRGARTQQRQTA